MDLNGNAQYILSFFVVVSFSLIVLTIYNGKLLQ